MSIFRLTGNTKTGNGHKIPKAEENFQHRKAARTLATRPQGLLKTCGGGKIGANPFRIHKTKGSMKRGKRHYIGGGNVQNPYKGTEIVGSIREKGKRTDTIIVTSPIETLRKLWKMGRFLCNLASCWGRRSEGKQIG